MIRRQREREQLAIDRQAQYAVDTRYFCVSLSMIVLIIGATALYWAFR